MGHHAEVNCDDSNFGFPRLYRQWVDHDLKYHEDTGNIRPQFYEGLKPEDQPRVWRFIEENYLFRYDEFMAVRFDWSSSGLWEMPFPASVRYGGNICLEGLGRAEQATRLLREWHDPLDAKPYDEYEEDYDEGSPDFVCGHGDGFETEGSYEPRQHPSLCRDRDVLVLPSS